MYIVVIGLGEVGRHLLGVFQAEGHDVVAVDNSADAIAYAEEHHDVASLEGYGGGSFVALKYLVDFCPGHLVRGFPTRRGQHRAETPQRQNVSIPVGAELSSVVG